MTENAKKLKALTEKVRVDLTGVKRATPQVSCKSCKIAQNMGTVKYCGCMK